jgi:hypothetical protein
MMLERARLSADTEGDGADLGFEDRRSYRSEALDHRPGSLKKRTLNQSHT